MTGAANPEQRARLSADQLKAADPQRRPWLSASAGTGKTQVLTARVLRLLLDGVRPQHILCLTFTKAGAAEMGRRLRRDLARWVRLPDDQLRHDLFAIGARHRDAGTLTKARQLFAEVIDAPGSGLAIQTIHSFCQSLLGAFPTEAGLAPGFQPLDEAMAQRLRQQVLADLIAHAGDTGDLPFLRRMEALSLRLGEAKAISWLERCLSAGEALEQFGPEIGPQLRQAFGLPIDGDATSWLIAQCGAEHVDEAALTAVRDAALILGGVRGNNYALAISEWLAMDAEARAAGLDELHAQFFTLKGTQREEFKKAAFAEVADLVARQAEWVRQVRATALAIHGCDWMADALMAGRQFARAYADAKREQGLVDFDDLIRLTVGLLENGDQQWIRYKLDQRIDHILVDEAQDTNVDQWRIISGIADEYFATLPQDDERHRTLFVVGDFKQAIFGFQGTDPIFFAAAREKFARQGAAAEKPLDILSIGQNFRSAPLILEAVDRVIASLGPDRLGLDEGAVRHVAFDDSVAGRVTLWPPEPAVPGDAEATADGEEDEEEGWVSTATRRVADRIAASVAHWIAHGIDGTPVAAGDIMVLVRRRGDIANLMVARLQAAGVPVAGVDRLRLQRPLAVQDLLAAARFAMQPLDDLNLAALLVSPLIGWSQDELWQRGLREPKVRLWEHLRAQENLREALSPLRALLGMADFVTPARFFETLLSGPLQGRAKLLARLGNAARDPIEELVSAARDFEARQGVSMHRFLQWFDSSDVDIKREQDDAPDEVRVITVHGAKGLEARIVILADACAQPDQMMHDGGAFEWEGVRLPLAPTRKDDQPEAVRAAIAAQQEREMREHWRLLYVAMTRAREMLFVAGALGKRQQEPGEGSWYAAIADALPSGLEPRAEATGAWPSAIIWSDGRKARSSRPDQSDATVTDIPPWARAAPAPESRPPRPLAPSSLEDEAVLAVPAEPPAAQDRRAAERGTLIHALFERLPDAEAAGREEAGRRYLARHGAALDVEERERMLAAVLAIITDPDHAALFGPGSLAEVPFSAVVAGRVIAGTVDRLLVTDTKVVVIDYKSGRFVPATAEAVQPAYLRQMAAYAAALGEIFPGRSIEAQLLYSHGPRAIIVPPALLARYAPQPEA